MDKRRRAEPVTPYRRRPKSTAGDPGQYVVYRIFAADKSLLYVGMTKRGGLRMGVHYKKPWGSEIRDLTAEAYPSKAAAAKEEARAIRTERPKYNVVHNQP